MTEPNEPPADEVVAWMHNCERDADCDAEPGAVISAKSKAIWMAVGPSGAKWVEHYTIPLVPAALLAATARERDAIRELMNVYNLGGWTDALAPMKRALAAESALAQAREALEGLRGKWLMGDLTQWDFTIARAAIDAKEKP